MAGVWKRDGTVAVTNGNKKVTGTGTTFADTKNGVAKGHLFCITSGTSVDFYEVDYVVSNTELYLVQAYRGATVTGKAYEVITTFSDSIPEFARRMTAMLGVYQGQSDVMQLLLTSDAASVTVTAPDGTSHNMIPWKRVTSEGEGQADRAKTEADKAQAAASTAVNVVREAALPLPDVWAPLAGSVRLITGAGREAKVGTDVVASYLNVERASAGWYFDRSNVLRKAEMNEARLEVEGLLVEGARTNILRWNSAFAGTGGGALTSVLSDKYPGITAKKVVGGTLTSALSSSREPIKDSTEYTATAIIDLDNSNIPNGKIRLQFGYSANWPARQVDVNVNTGALTALDANTKGTARLYGRLLVVTATTTSTSTASASGGGAVTLYYLDAAGVAAVPPADGSMCVVGFQLEEGPGASSFILTSDAAVTRAAEYPYLPRAGNDNYFGPITIAAEVHLNAPGVAGNVTDARRGILSGYPSVGAYEILMVDPSNGRPAWAYGGSQFAGGGNQPALNDGNIHTVVAQMDGTNNRVYSDGVKGTGDFAATPVYGADNGSGKERWHLGYGAGGTTVRHLWGHLRNLRIWHRALSAAQCQALR